MLFDSNSGFVAEALDASTLSWGTRIKGFLACFVIGVFISVLSSVLFALSFSLSTFAILYTLGKAKNIHSLIKVALF